LVVLSLLLFAESPKILQKMLEVVFKYSRKYSFVLIKISNVMIFGRKCRQKF